jgi:hypothetical protein
MKRKTVVAIVGILLILATTALAEQRFITKEGYPAAVSKKYLKFTIRLINTKDVKALKQLRRLGLFTILRGGIEVELLDASYFSGYVCIRPFGSIKTIWTVADAIERK